MSMLYNNALLLPGTPKAKNNNKQSCLLACVGDHELPYHNSANGTGSRFIALVVHTIKMSILQTPPVRKILLPPLEDRHWKPPIPPESARLQRSRRKQAGPCTEYYLQYGSWTSDTIHHSCGQNAIAMTTPLDAVPQTTGRHGRLRRCTLHTKPSLAFNCNSTTKTINSSSPASNMENRKFIQ